MMDTPQKEALKALRAEPVGVLATVSKSGEPWAAVVHFLVDDEFNFYFLTRKSTLKYKNVIANGNVSFNVGLFNRVKYGNFQIAGWAERLTENDAWEKFMRTLFTQRQVNDLHMDARKDDVFHGLDGHDYVLLIMKPTFVRWLRVTKGKPSYTVVVPQ